MVKANSDRAPVDALSIKVLNEVMNLAITRSTNTDGCALSFVEVVALREILDELTASTSSIRLIPSRRDGRSAVNQPISTASCSPVPGRCLH